MAITQVSNSLVKQDLTISGGTVDNTVIGSGTPAAGTFTTVAGTLASTVTGTTAAASDNSTKIATTAYVTTAIANLVDTAPSALNTLNELAAALGDDANFATTVNSSIAAKAALAGATFTGSVQTTGLNTRFISNSTSSGDYIRIYAGSGTGKWDIYGNGANLRIGDNDSAGIVAFDTGITVGGTLNGITTTQSASGTRWGVLPEIAANGVMEIGRYVDFHATSGDTSDYGARFDFDGSKMILTSNFEGAGTGTFSSTLTGQKLVATDGLLELDDNGTHNGIINVPASMRINFDSDNNSTGESFQVGVNATNISGSNILFQINEDGSVFSVTPGTSNTRYGYNAGNSIIAGGNYNVFIGDNAGTNITTGDNSVAVGYNALAAEDGHGFNVAVGKGALNVLNAGTDAYNVAVGVSAGGNLQTGTSNTLVGALAGDALTTGSLNTAVGINALGSDTQGSRSIAIGRFALGNQNFSSSVTVSYNTVVGYAAGGAITTGTSNTLMGYNAGDGIIAGTENTAYGMDSLSAIVNGNFNTAVGADALKRLSGSTNYTTGIGRDAGVMATTADNCVWVGGNAGPQASTSTGNNNVGVGFQSQFSVTSGHSNVAMGTSSQYGLTDGVRNVSMGYASLENGTLTGSDNVAIGHNCGNQMSSGLYNTLMGAYAGDALNSSNYNVAIGYNALTSETTGLGSTAIGYEALKNQNVAGGSNTQNTAIGYNAGKLIASATLNTAIGALALDAEVNGHRNTAVGYGALSTQQSGTSNNTSNTGVGFHAGVSITSGYHNTLIGSDAGDGISNGYGNTVLGFNADVGGGGAVGRIAIGTQVVCNSHQRITVGYGSNTASLELDGSDTSWAANSDERLKENIVDSTAGLSFINDLRPVTYNWKKAKDIPSDLPQYVEGSEDPCLGYEYGKELHGFVAQEVKTAIDNHSEVKEGQSIWMTDETTVQTLAPAGLIPMLVKSIQELSAEVTALKAEVAALKGE